MSARPQAAVRTASGTGLRVLMTVDAVGGVWRYAMDLAAGLAERGGEVVFAGFGPHPSATQAREARRLGELVWFDEPLDWMCREEREHARVPRRIEGAAERLGVDLVQVNVPSQAAGLEVDVPVLAVSHSCVASWFLRVRRQPLPDALAWQQRLHRAGFDRAAAVVAPSASHAEDLLRCYGPISGLSVVHNAAGKMAFSALREAYAFAAARWWDAAKGGAVLDAAAAMLTRPVVMAGACAGPDGQAMTLHHARAAGPLDHAQTLAHMRRAAVFVSPSLYEPFGLAALEAARCGAALVLADSPTYRELWDGVAAFAAPGDVDGFARAIARLISEPVLRERQACRALERSRDFLPRRQAAAMASLYERLVSNAVLPAVRSNRAR